LAGADMTSWLENEVKSIPAWARSHEDAVEDYYLTWAPYVMLYKKYEYWCTLSGSYFDYRLDPVSADMTSPCEIYKQPYYNPDGTIRYTYITVNGVVVHGVKINNMMWAVFARAWGWPPGAVSAGSDLNQICRSFTFDTPAAAYAVIFGAHEMFYWAEDGEGPITEVLTSDDLREMQEPPETDPDLHILWPSPDPLDPSESCMERPDLPIPFP
jgi:hypothetical protein